jgi:GNAT superfamily N-acetyltransferase
VRIDLIGEKAAGLRLIGVRGDLQRQGHGRALLRLAEQTARALGKAEIVINAHPSSLAFYLANGYREGEWDEAGPPPPASFGWENACRDIAIDSAQEPREFQHRVAAVTGAINRPQSPPL